MIRGWFILIIIFFNIYKYRSKFKWLKKFKNQWNKLRSHLFSLAKFVKTIPSRYPKNPKSSQKTQIYSLSNYNPVNKRIPNIPSKFQDQKPSISDKKVPLITPFIKMKLDNNYTSIVIPNANHNSGEPIKKTWRPPHSGLDIYSGKNLIFSTLLKKLKLEPDVSFNSPDLQSKKPNEN